MRDIKFRAWGLVSKQMYSWTQILCDDNKILTIGLSPDLSRLIWLQYIGLLDKNGKEIYEGDIIQDTDSHENGQVYWDDDSLCWQALFDDNDSWGFVSQKGRDNHCEIIGNIHENPELLEVKDEGNAW